MPAFSAGGPGSGNLDIGVAIVLHDRFSNQARVASSAINALYRDARMAVNANLSALSGVATAVSGVATVLSAGIIDAINYGAEFGDTMTYVHAITSATAGEMADLTEQAMSLGMATMFSSKDVASGMKYLAMAGNDAKEIRDIIQSAAYVANATGMELGGKGGTADLLTNVMKTFKLEGREAANIVGDQLSQAAAAANTSMADLAVAIKYAGADAVSLGQSLPSVAAAVGVLGNAGIQGSMAGTALGNMMRYLTKSIAQPSYKGAKALASLGLSRADLVDAKGNLRDIGEVLGKLNLATKGMDPVDRTTKLLDIFGVRGNRAAVALLRNLDEYQEILTKINKSEGFAQRVTAERMNTMAGAINKLVSAWNNLKASFTKSIEPFFKPFINGIAGILSALGKFTQTGFGKVVTIVTTIHILSTKILANIIAMAARIKMMMNDSQVTAANMRAVLFGRNLGVVKGWNFQDKHNLLVAQRLAGVNASPYDIFMRATMLKDGYAGYQKVRNPAYDPRKNPRAPRYLYGYNGEIIPYRQYQKGISNLSRQVKAAGGPGPGMVVHAGLGGAIKGLTKVGNGLLSFFGGPVGVALLVLPLIASGISALVERHRKNQEALAENTKAIQLQIAQNQENREKQYRDSLRDELQGYLNILREINAKIPDSLGRNFNINVNGTPAAVGAGGGDYDVDLDNGTR